MGAGLLQLLSDESVILVPCVRRPWREVGTSIFLNCKGTKNSIFLLQKIVGFDAKILRKSDKNRFFPQCLPACIQCCVINYSLL